VEVLWIVKGKRVLLKLGSLVRISQSKFQSRDYIVSGIFYTVLPRFSVELSTFKRIERNDTKIRGIVSAK